METQLKWQNLVHKKCPRCGMKLKQVINDWARLIFVCPLDECNIGISQKKYYEILSDKNHVLRRYLSIEEKDKAEAEVELLKGLFDN